MKQKKKILLKVDVQLKLKQLVFEISGEFRFNFGHDYYIFNIIINAFKNNAFSIKIKTKIKKNPMEIFFFLRDKKYKNNQ